jgi:hypothetical protein
MTTGEILHDAIDNATNGDDGKAIALLVKSSFLASVGVDASGLSYDGIPVRATLPEAWPHPYLFVFVGDAVHIGWTLFGGIPVPDPYQE